MKWLELSVETPPEFVEPLSNIFYRYGHGGVAVESDGGYNPDEGETPDPDRRVTVKTYLPLNDSTQERRNHIDLGVRLVAHVSTISTLLEREIDEKDWEEAWKEHFHTLHVGKNIVIAPSWRDYSPEETDVVVNLDPEMAFGTGHHPTTRMCLELLEKLQEPGMDVLDVGCGSGILSIAAAKLGARSVFGLDVDQVAVNVATRNTRLNGVAHAVRVTQGSLPRPDVRPHSYDVALANISARVVSEMSADLVRAVRSGGRILASGILVENSRGVEQALTSAGGRLDSTVVEGDWVTLVASVP